MSGATRGVRSAWKREIASALGLRQLRVASSALLVGGCATVLLVAWCWWSGRDLARAAGIGWGLTLAVLLLLLLLLAWPRRRFLRAAARRWDLRLGARGALLTATWLLREPHPTRLAGLVMSQAGAALGTPPRERGASPVPRRLGTVLGLLCMTVLLLLLPLPDPPRAAGAVRSVAGPGAAGAVPAAGAGQPADADADVPMVHLDSLVTLSLKTLHRVYLLGQDIDVDLELKTRGQLDAPLVLEARLGVADGLPFPDVGFGPGFRPLRFPGPLELAAEPGSSAATDLELRRALEQWKIYKPGLYTLEARAIARVPGGEELGAVVSNRVTIQVSENRERTRFRQPSPVEKQRKPDAPRTQRRPKEPPRGQKGRKAPGLGEEDRLRDAQRLAQAIKPLLTDGPMVDKEVNVFERERGGRAPPRQDPLAAPDLGQRPGFQRMPESRLPRLTLSPLERRLIRRYFSGLSRGR